MNGGEVKVLGRFEKKKIGEALDKQSLIVGRQWSLWVTIYVKPDNSASLEALAPTTSTIHSAA